MFTVSGIEFLAEKQFVCSWSLDSLIRYFRFLNWCRGNIHEEKHANLFVSR